MDDLQQVIRHVATDLFAQTGYLPGHDFDNWLAAEKLVLTWYEPDLEREKHVGAEVPDDHVIEASREQVSS